MAKKCTQCGRELRDFEVFCSYCGAKQESKTVAANRSQEYRQPEYRQPEPPKPEYPQPVLTESLNRPEKNYMQSPEPYVEKPKSKAGAVIALIAVVLVLAAGLSAYFIFTGSKVRQNTPEKLFDSSCDIAERALNNNKICSEKELKAFYEYSYGDDSAKYMTKAYYNYAASYLCNAETSARLRQEFGTDITISYYIENDEIVQPSDYYEWIDPSTPTGAVREMHRYTLQVTVSGSVNSETETMTIILVNANNKWYYATGTEFRSLRI